MPARDRDTELGGPARAFPPTRHSALRELAHDEPGARRAAEETLVRAYWKPAYAYVRLAWRASNEDAKELVQGFFAAALEKRVFDGFDPARGRFRSFLRGCLDHHVQHVREALGREKRGGGARAVPLDPAVHDAPDRAPAPEEELDARFRREWARHLFELGIEGLRQRCAELDKPVAFRVFERYDLHDSDRGRRPTYAEIASELGLPETQVTNHLHWARKELRALLYAELRAVTASEAELADEARWLLGADGG
jgi:RNA polymerase sigma factor (sigma-70 family)